MKHRTMIITLVSAAGVAGAASTPFVMKGGPFTVRASFDQDAKLGPCIPDFNGDGRLDVSDYSAFCAALAAQDPRADIAMPRGVFDAADMMAFHTGFMEGCR